MSCFGRARRYIGMRTLAGTRRLGVALMLAAAPYTLSAQRPGDAVVAPPLPPIAAWASIGLGPGTVAQSSSAFAGAARANLTVGRLLFMYRSAGVGPFLGSGDGVNDEAFLVGVRTSGHRLFAMAAVGFDSARRYHDCMEGCTRTTDASRTSALAWDLSLHANALVPGLSLSYAGALGSSHVRYSALTLGVELGWFGR